jgi:hypothetical protein
MAVVALLALTIVSLVAWHVYAKKREAKKRRDRTMRAWVNREET